MKGRISTHLTYAEIDLRALRMNFRSIKERVGNAKMMAVVKADGYGHGALEVSRALVEEGADYLALAFVDEALALRDAGITTPMLVFAKPFRADLESLIAEDVDVTITTADEVSMTSEVAVSQGRRARVHLKVDTGLSRLGVPPAEAVSISRSIEDSPELELRGVYSHFAKADAIAISEAKDQFRVFRSVLDGIEEEGIEVPLRHMAGSAAIVALAESHLDMVRPGLMLYGLYPDGIARGDIDLEPVMTLKSVVELVKEVDEGTAISYGGTYIAPERTSIATVPVGYADGYDRRLGNSGEVLIGGRRCSVVGQVCMDMIMVDVGNQDVKAGHEVVIYGAMGNGAISIEEVARKIGTIPYEVSCSVSKRVPRVYVG